MRVWLALTVILAGTPARGDGLRRIGPCLVDPATTAGVVDARIERIDQPSHGCGRGAGDLDPALYDVLTGAPTADTGCVVVTDSPYCAAPEPPAELAVTIDGAARRVPYAAGIWQACGLTPGAHAIEMCSPRGTLRCSAAVTAGARAFVAITASEAVLHVEVVTSRLGTARAGDKLDVVLAGGTAVDHVELPERVTLAWATAAAVPRVRVCSGASSPSPGCTRCDAGGELGAGTIALAAALAVVIGRRR